MMILEKQMNIILLKKIQILIIAYIRTYISIYLQVDLFLPYSINYTIMIIMRVNMFRNCHVFRNLN